MMAPGRLVQRTTDGEVATAGVPLIVTAVILSAGSGATGTVDLKTGGSSGTTLLSLTAPQATTVAVPFPAGIVFPQGCYCALTGSGASVSVAYE
jgi:hypothetical protein